MRVCAGDIRFSRHSASRWPRPGMKGNARKRRILPWNFRALALGAHAPAGLLTGVRLRRTTDTHTHYSSYFRVYGGCAASKRARVAVGGLARRRRRPRAGAQQLLGLVVEREGVEGGRCCPRAGSCGGAARARSVEVAWASAGWCSKGGSGCAVAGRTWSSRLRAVARAASSSRRRSRG